MQPLEHATAKRAATHGHKPAIIVLIAAVLLAGVLVRWCVDVHQNNRLAEAKSMCAEASEALRVAQNKYNTLHDGKAAEAAKITDRQVEDAKTVAALAAAYKEEAPGLAACNVQGVDGLREARERIDKNAAWYGTHTASLSKAVDAVNESHDAKTLTDTKDALSKQLKVAEAKYKTTDGKVQDDKTRKDLKTLIDKAFKIKDGTDVKAMNSQAKQLKDLLGKVDASVKAKTDADRKAAGDRRNAKRKRPLPQRRRRRAVRPNSRIRPRIRHPPPSVHSAAVYDACAAGSPSSTQHGRQYWWRPRQRRTRMQ